MALNEPVITQIPEGFDLAALQARAMAAWSMLGATVAPVVEQAHIQDGVEAEPAEAIAPTIFPPVDVSRPTTRVRHAPKSIREPGRLRAWHHHQDESQELAHDG
ncbi:hypothetical protein BJ508DRAFT_326789 [Ascobolus immersus RN42]|uniref:Uncharacterized protein n=1 Tax=Ascobolus immersus RN42 TaxID=1160509 RepID=A0A3N4I9S4_ASCIM|nr:hypothetical protein BJ508DRAFT_326789 [Ascobolus immersus RN42]